MTPEHGERYRRIAAVLGRHGLGWFAAGLGVGRHPDEDAVDAGRPTSRSARAREVRAALEELGPTFVKLGQLLSMRRDLLPPEYVAELERLQDAAEAVPWDEVRVVLEHELGAPVDELFGAFDTVPLACASLGQAHAAVLHDGTEVVVKVRRPGVVALVDVDLDIVQDLADRAARRWRAAREHDLPGLAAEFGRSLRAELDYRREAEHAERFGAAFAGDPRIRIPAVHRSTSTSRVLTLDRMRGIKVDDLAALDAQRVDRRAVIATAIDALARMIFVDGFFHADPHPGNLFVEPDGRIALIDFGMVGRLDEAVQRRLADLFVALARGDAGECAAALTALCSGPRATGPGTLRDDVARFMRTWTGRTLGAVRMTPLLLRLMVLLRRNRLRLPPDVALLVRALLIVDDIGARLEPDFDLGAALRPYAARLVRRRSSASALLRRLLRAAADAAALGVELPEHVREALARLDADGIAVHLRADELEPLVGRIERVGDRLVVGVVTAALITGVGQLLGPVPGRDRALSRSLLDAGLGAVGVLGAYLAWSRRRR
ncbi:ABC1 kinase family protein [Amnibacterium kyonggiense]|uniref:Ubiquinone biosynthesis protein n=1 Tax=Amnibacterium kyonggiense TaxID=595671 RepID=A0A4R7FKH4_9MICO|nr:AarF/UbiB family protein [Amnibacterium kyonggiense]TDS76855.1 ubiquinone biosynthesis protein [Amnibacterium kyonggiense]